MTLGSQMYDAVHLLLSHQLKEGIKVADIHLHKSIVGSILDILEIGEVSRIGKLIQIDNLVIRILIYKKSYDMTPDKSGSTGNYNRFHTLFSLMIIFSFSQ